MSGHSLLDSVQSWLYRPRLKDIVRRIGIDAHLRTLYVALYRLRYGEAITVEIGPATADIGIGSAAELDNIVSISGKERPVARTIVEELNEDEVFWDVGANVGTFSCIAGDVLETGTVVAFEPYPPNVEQLERNLQRNGVPYAIEPRALSDTDDERTFFVMGTEEAGSREGSIEDSYAAATDAVRTITVETTTADRVVEADIYPPPNVVKIDVEGAAPAVLEGMDATLARPECRLLVVEPHDNEATIETVLEDAGFRSRSLRVDGSNRIVAERAE
ncbi:FkbM family methyltransferase [Natronomonas gomsonensis]|uniref:FkbM family methyltransferase n=1 Tax=Natronomonas gomsonensis TaxID=1046043 RepID=UPI0015BC0A7D|nr:FkbM family methyltransferase [Natronomonas gomsonensis]